MPGIGTLSETLDTLYTTTWYHRKDSTADNVFDAYPLMKWMKSKGRMKSLSGGRRIETPLEYGENTNLSWITKGSTVALNDFEFLTIAQWNWKYLAASIVRFGVDDQQNRAKMAIINLMNAKLNNTRKALTKELETLLFAGAHAGNGIDGLQTLVADDPTTSTSIGGINQSTYTWWRNKTKNMTTLSSAAWLTYWMRDTLNNVSNNYQEETPDVIVTGQTPFQYYEDNVLDFYRAYSNKLGDLGIRNIEFKGIDMIWSPSCGTRMYFLNTDYLLFFYDPMWYFEMTEWKSIPNQPMDRAAQIMLACAFATNRRRAHGVMYNIDTA